MARKFAVLGCVAQQEGEKIFDKAPHVSMVCGSASYNQLPQMLVQLEAGDRRVTGLKLDTELTFDTPLTRRDNPQCAYITIIEGCDKACAYCVVPFTRGPERSRTSASVLAEAGQLAAMGYTEIQLLGQNVNSYRDPSSVGWDFAQLLDAVGRVAGIRRVRFTTSHPRDFKKSIVDAIENNAALCNHVHLPVQSGSTRILEAMQRLYTREEYLQRIAWMKASTRPIAITSDIIVGFPGETEADLEATLDLPSTVGYDAIFSFSIAAPQYRGPAARRSDPGRGEIPPAGDRAGNINASCRLCATPPTSAASTNAWSEGFNKATGQWMGRTSEHKTLNFLYAGSEDLSGQYVYARVTRSGPNALTGERVQ